MNDRAQVGVALPVAFTEECVRCLWDEVQPLLAVHYAEISAFPDIALDPIKLEYFALEDAGVLRCFAVRDPDGALIGYAAFFIRRNLHYGGSVQAWQDVLFILPEWRGRGRAFIEWCDAQVFADPRGVAVIWQHIKAAHNFGPMLERIGYELTDHIYARRRPAALEG